MGLWHSKGVMHPDRHSCEKVRPSTGPKSLNSGAHQIQQGPIWFADAGRHSDFFNPRRKIAPIEQLVEAIPGHKQVQSVEVPVIPDDHLCPVAMLTQHRRNAGIIMHVMRLHCCRTLPGIVRTEGREQASSCLNSVRKEMLEINT